MQSLDVQRYGENVFWCKSDNINGEDPVNIWYAQVSDYNFDLGKLSMDTRNLTQILWKNSKRLGVGLAQSAAGDFIVVAIYYPRGNVAGTLLENVPPRTAIRQIKIVSEEHIIPPRNAAQLASENPTRTSPPSSSPVNVSVVHADQTSPGRESIGLTSVDRNSIGRTNVDRNSVRQSSMDRNSVVRNSVIRNSVGLTSVGRNSVGAASEGRNSVYRSSIGTARTDYRASQAGPSSQIVLTTDNGFNEMEIEFVTTHNQFRKAHGVPLLFLNKKMCQLASERAKVSYGWVIIIIYSHLNYRG